MEKGGVHGVGEHTKEKRGHGPDIDDCVVWFSLDPSLVGVSTLWCLGARWPISTQAALPRENNGVELGSGKRDRATFSIVKTNMRRGGGEKTSFLKFLPLSSAAKGINYCNCLPHYVPYPYRILR